MDTESLADRLRSPSRPPIEDDQVEALGANLVDGETVVYDLTSGGGLRRLDDEGDIDAATDGGTVLLVTDRKLLFAVATVNGPVVGAISFTDVKQIDWRDGILRSRIDVAVWGEGSYRFDPAERSEIAAVGGYVETMSDVWDDVAARIGDARQHVNEVKHRIEAGEEEAAYDHASQALSLLARGRDRASDAPEPRDSLVEEIEAVQASLAETRVQAHTNRSETLRQRGEDHERHRRYEAAHECYRRAIEQREIARSVAADREDPTLAAIEADLDALAEAQTALEARPLAEAEDAHEKAEAADPERALLLYDEALDRYRDALTAGWGIDAAAFDGDEATLRERIEAVVSALVDTRVELAAALISEGDDLAFASETAEAEDRYEAAKQHLVAARALAREYVSGDVDALEKKLTTLRDRKEGPSHTTVEA